MLYSTPRAHLFFFLNNYKHVCFYIYTYIYIYLFVYLYNQLLVCVWKLELGSDAQTFVRVPIVLLRFSIGVYSRTKLAIKEG